MYLKTFLSLAPFVIGGADAVYWIARRDVQTAYQTTPDIFQCMQDQSVWVRKFALRFSNIRNPKVRHTEYSLTLDII
jgi:hypothetical protein